MYNVISELNNSTILCLFGTWACISFESTMFSSYLMVFINVYYCGLVTLPTFNYIFLYPGKPLDLINGQFHFENDF